MAGRVRSLHEKIRRAGLAAASLLFVDSSALADEPSRPIEEALTVGPSRCLEAKPLAQHVTMWLKRSSIDRRISVEISDAPDGVRFVVRRDGVVLGQRTLEVAKIPCQEIHAALGLGIASAIDGTVLEDLGVTAKPSAPPVESVPPRLPPGLIPPPPMSRLEPPPHVASIREPAPQPAQHGPVLTITVQGVALINVLPKVTLAFAPSAELSILRGFDLRASALVTGNTAVTVGSGTGDAALIAGRFDACAGRVLLDDLARIRGCAGLFAGAVNASGTGFPDNRTTTAPWVAPALRVDARWSLTRLFGIVVGVDGLFPGLKPELQVVDKTQKVVAAQRFPLAGVTFDFGPSITF
jgi:hypothetical protein